MLNFLLYSLKCDLKNLADFKDTKFSFRVFESSLRMLGPYDREVLLQTFVRPFVHILDHTQEYTYTLREIHAHHTNMQTHTQHHRRHHHHQHSRRSYSQRILNST